VDEKDKIIATLAVGFLLSTSLAAMLAMTGYLRYGMGPDVHLAEFHAEDELACDGHVSVSYYLANSGKAGFAQVEVVADGVAVLRNNYFVDRGNVRQVLENVYLDDCVSHVFNADITAAWA